MQLQAMNLAQQMKWVRQIIGPSEDLVPMVLKGNYDMWQDWEKRATPVQEVSAFCHGLRQLFPQVCKFSIAISLSGTLMYRISIPIDSYMESLSHC